MGGGFGGKESQACAWAAMAALGALVTGAPCKVRLDRDDDFALTGKRHAFRNDWRVGFDDEGRIDAYDVALNANCGCSADLSPGVVDRAMFHASNCYYLPVARVASRRLKTNIVSMTAFRGFGGPQGMIGIERAMEGIARENRAADPLERAPPPISIGPAPIRRPTNQFIEDCETLPAILADLEASSDYRARREAVRAFNETSPILKKGISLGPVQFRHLVHAHSISTRPAPSCMSTRTARSSFNHGGTEMGQGLFTKVAQVVAEEFGVPLDYVRITATNHRQGAERLADGGVFRGPTSTAWRPRSRRGRCGSAWPPLPPKPGGCRPTPWSSARAGFSAATLR